MDHYDKLWCSTKVGSDTDELIQSQWKTCDLKEYGGNDGERPCVLPFVYKGQTFDNCTKQDATAGDFWCATTENYDKDGKWSYCADTGIQPDGSYVYQGP
nr:epididymal sperm-binding protein 1-like [Zootoca vivipara]